jgi:hypothetical protein
MAVRVATPRFDLVKLSLKAIIFRKILSKI